MDTQRQRRRIAALGSFGVLIMAGLLLAACGPFLIPASTPSPPRPPDIIVLDAPERVCGTATQLRVEIQTSTNYADNAPGTWALTDPSGDTVHEGTWIFREGAFLVPFPEGHLEPGSYSLKLEWESLEIAYHGFVVDAAMPAITELSILHVAPGSPLAQLDEEVDLFYITYAFEGGCVGSPYWIVVRDEQGGTVCSRDDTLEKTSGSDTLVCHLEGEAPLESGTYEVEMTFMSVSKTASIDIEPPPPTPAPTHTPTPRPTPGPVTCDPLFTAAGLSPDGEPSVILTIFDWYTQAVYAGSACRNLTPGTRWRSTWQREGEPIRETNGVWEGPTEGIVWDSLTGKPDNPFLLPGTYTVTLIVEKTPLSATFEVFEYPSATPAE